MNTIQRLLSNTLLAVLSSGIGKAGISARAGNVIDLRKQGCWNVCVRMYLRSKRSVSHH